MVGRGIWEKGKGRMREDDTGLLESREREKVGWLSEMGWLRVGR